MSEIKPPDSQENEKTSESVIDSSKLSHAASTKNGSIADQAKGNPVTTELAAASNTINEIKEKAGFFSRYLGYVKQAREYLKIAKGNRYTKILDTGLNIAANFLEAGDYAIRGDYKKAIVSGAKGVGSLAGGAITGAATTAALAHTGPFAAAGIFLVPEAASLGAKAGEKVLGDIAQYAVDTFWPDDANDPDERPQDTPGKNMQKKQEPGLYDAHGTKFHERHGDSEKSPVIPPQKTIIDRIHDDELQIEVDKLLEADAKANEASQTSKTLSSKVKYKWNPDDTKPSSSKAKTSLIDIPTPAIPKTKAATTSVPKLDLPKNPALDKTLKQPLNSTSENKTKADQSVLQQHLPDGNLSDPILSDSCYDTLCEKSGDLSTCNGRVYICIRKNASQHTEQSEENSPQDSNVNQASEPQTYTPPGSSAPESVPEQTSLLRQSNFAPSLQADFTAAAGAGLGSGAGFNITINQSVSVGSSADVPQVQTAMNEANSKAQNDWEGIVANLFRDQRRVEYGATSGVA